MSQFVQFSHEQNLVHLIPLAKHEQYFLSHLIFLHVQYFLYVSNIGLFFRFYIAYHLVTESILF